MSSIVKKKKTMNNTLEYHATKYKFNFLYINSYKTQVHILLIINTWEIQVHYKLWTLNYFDYKPRLSEFNYIKQNE